MADVPHASHLSADRPVQSLKDDLLGRGEFALSLANSLAAWRGEESLIIALYGPWGSGKSSVKNFVLEFLLRGERPVSVVEFNPWGWSGQDRLMSAFFAEVGLAIGREGNGEARKAIAAKWKNYAARLTAGGKVLGFFKSAAGWIGIPILPALLGGAGAAVEKGVDALLVGSDVISPEDSEEPLEKLKAALAEDLKKLEQPVLVVMDDIDRLTKDEIRLLFQLVKVNADFPNLMFLLLFERAVVEDALSGVSGSKGREYMEKIVQAGFDLPAISRSELDHAFLKALYNVATAYPGADRNFEADRWPRFFQRGLRPFLETMRDVRRFISSFSFSLGLFFRQGTLEVNVMDLIGIELLRIFEPDVYSHLPDNRDVLIRSTGFSYSGRDESKELDERLKQLVERGSSQRQDAIRALLGELFPTLTQNFGPGFEEEWLRGLRVCSGEMFGRYFLLGVPKDDVPQSLIDLVVKASASAEAIAGLLRQLRDEGRLPALLSRLGAYTAVLDLELAENFITALFDVGEELSDRGENMFDLGGPAMSANRVVYHWLKREPDPKVRSAILLNAIRRSKGLHLPLDRVSLEVQRHAKDKLEESHFTAADLDEAKHIVLERVEAAAKDGQLLGTRLLRYLWRWRNLAGADAPKTFVAAQITTARGALMLLQGMMEEVNVASLSSGVQRQKRGLHIRTLQEFLDVDKLTEILSPLLGSEVAPEHRELVNSFAEELRAFKRALHRKAKGMPDDDSFDDD